MHDAAQQIGLPPLPDRVRERLAADPFAAVDFALPRGAGRKAAAADCGTACGLAWRAHVDAVQAVCDDASLAMPIAATPPYRYPAALAQWRAPLKAVWFEAYVAPGSDPRSDFRTR